MAVAAGEWVPVLYVDLTEEEEALVLATLDPISAQAEKDQVKLNALLAELQASELGQNLGASLDSLLADLTDISPEGDVGETFKPDSIKGVRVAGEALRGSGGFGAGGR